jgi:hypothetical protein
LSELGLAQSEIAFRQHFQHKRTVTSINLWNCTVTNNLWYNSLSPTETRRKVLEDGCQDELRDTLLRGPKAAVQKTESRHTATLGLFLAGDALGGSSRKRLCENVLRYLIAILNRNTLVPSAARWTERGR